MNKTTLIIGGCRSGKSHHALKLAEGLKTDNKLFIATCVPYDNEMKKRVERHQRERSDDWQTLEVPLKLPEAIQEYSLKSDLILVDCLTLWITNLLMETDDPDSVTTATQHLQAALQKARCPVILVSNEVGAGIVPGNRLARQFRDAAGQTNQQVAACVDRVIWMVAGIPVTVKPSNAECGMRNVECN
jgi:adenosylcobinamide kinase/adenosylcobinamide-phosphate guanylyltransferase